jgi:hypothetical protein
MISKLRATLEKRQCLPLFKTSLKRKQCTLEKIFLWFKPGKLPKQIQPNHSLQVNCKTPPKMPLTQSWPREKEMNRLQLSNRPKRRRKPTKREPRHTSTLMVLLKTPKMIPKKASETKMTLRNLLETKMQQNHSEMEIPPTAPKP